MNADERMNLFALEARAERAEKIVQELKRLLRWAGDTWDTIYGQQPAASWTANPWVWVVGFKVPTK